jgi:hypothetical protein
MNQELLKGDFRQNKKLDISDLKKGIYFIRVENEGQIVQKKIIKQ